MSNTKHTPGPWSCNGKEIRAHNSMILATVYTHIPANQSEEEALSNAKLIAAAPELLEALKELTSLAPDHSLLPTDFDNDLMNAIKKAEAAIQKATE